MDEKIINEITEITNKRTSYGTSKIELHWIRPTIVWVGTNGHTNSVGQWIRITKNLINQGINPTKGYKWNAVVSVCEDGTTDSLWYYGVKIDQILYICGGMTDFSGEGNHGRQLAENYLKGITNENLITESNSDGLINNLIGTYD